MSKKKERDNGLPECRITSHRLGDHMKIIRVGLELTNERLQVLDEICKIRGEDFREYVEKALNDQMDNDLETPNDLGLDYCKHLKHILSGSLS
jgi:RNA binding exosome subunit